MSPNTSGKSPVGKGNPSWPHVGPMTLLGVGSGGGQGPRAMGPEWGFSSLAALVPWALQLFAGGCPAHRRTSNSAPGLYLLNASAQDHQK